MTTPTPSEGLNRPATDSGLSASASIGMLPFHVFLGAHSLLIGMVPFYLPVWLWRHGMGLDGLSILIGVSGISFALALKLWQHLGRTRNAIRLISIGFTLELVLVLVSIAATLLLPRAATGIGIWLIAASVGIAAGCYNAFFWTTQRALFAASLRGGDAGKRYGNFQIYVAVLLKIGIILGGLLLDKNALIVLALLSCAVGTATTLWLASALPREPLLSRHHRPLKLASGTLTKTRAIFAIDGVLLLLESHFWTLSLFVLFGEDFMRLGTLVVVLGIAFAVLFWLSKNLVDRFAINQVFRVAVVLYAASWALRSAIDSVGERASLGAVLVSITFATSFFRLAFNKRFFEHASACGVVPYLLWKSRVSQYALGVVFLGIGLGLSLGTGDAGRDLSVTYIVAAIASMIYLLYQPPAVVGKPQATT